MKVLATLLLLAFTAVSAEPVILEQQVFNELAFANRISYNVWNGFVRGLYRDHIITTVNPKCFGDWIQENLTHLDNVFGRLVNLQFDIAYEEAKNAAIDTVDLIYKNREFCDFDKVYQDLVQMCLTDECILANLFKNIQKNVFQIAMRVESMWELIIKQDFESDEEIFAVCDKVGENYGSLVSFVLGFDKRLDGMSHKYRI